MCVQLRIPSPTFGDESIASEAMKRQTPAGCLSLPLVLNATLGNVVSRGVSPSVAVSSVPCGIRLRISAQRHLRGLVEMPNKFARVSPILVLMGITALLCTASFGHVFSGSLTGVVKDPSGEI